MLANNACTSVAPGPTTVQNPLTNTTAATMPTPTAPITNTSTSENVTPLPTAPTLASAHHPFTHSQSQSQSQSQTQPRPEPPAPPPPLSSPFSSTVSSTGPMDHDDDTVDETTQATTATQSSSCSSSRSSSGTSSADATHSTHSDDNSKTDNIGPVAKRPKARPTPFSKPILLSADRRNRKKKSITWQSDEKIQRVHYFELIANERVNVSRNLSNEHTVVDNSASSGLNPNSLAIANLNAPEARNDASAATRDGLKRREWRLILIDYNHDLPCPGWNSIERSAQAERETYVLGAIDLPGQPSTLDEPDGNQANSMVARNEQGVKIIPLDNPDGMYTVYPDLSSSEIVNGVRVPAAGSQPFGQNAATFNSSHPSQFITNSPLQPQLVNNVHQNPFSFQDMNVLAAPMFPNASEFFWRPNL